MQKNIKKVQIMDNLINNIVSYIKYLINDCGLRVSVHFDRHTFDCLPKQIVNSLLPYNSHTNSYCTFVKGKDYNKCLQNQKNLLIKCQRGESFCDICYAGVSEYIHPVRKGAETVGFVAVSGYREEASRQLAINCDLWEAALDGNQIPLELCNVVIPPLCIMLAELLSAYSKKCENEYNLILQFLNEYHANITLCDLARHFVRSNSHISHLFKTECGMTIRAYCNNLKLEDAKNFLLNTDMPITEIAYDAGFNDVSYFISLFKKKFGIAPLQYRKSNQ